MTKFQLDYENEGFKLYEVWNDNHKLNTYALVEDAFAAVEKAQAHLTAMGVSDGQYTVIEATHRIVNAVTLTPSGGG